MEQRSAVGGSSADDANNSTKRNSTLIISIIGIPDTLDFKPSFQEVPWRKSLKIMESTMFIDRSRFYIS